LAFWQGSKFIVDGETSLSKILTIMMAVLIGAFSLGNIAPNFQAFLTAAAAAAKIFNTIDRVSPLDPTDDKGEKLEKLQGNIRLENIKHIYPSRPEVTVMKGVSLDIPAGKTTALVGASGSGKSTIVGLVERFYEPVEGTIYLDGHDITKLNLRWLRQQMALVSQEPTLFGTTIFNNIRHGLIGTAIENESAEKQHERVIEAAKKANAHDFITSLPEGYETNVGERGFLLSGGQKQRIAIARAIVSDPKSKWIDFGLKISNDLLTSSQFFFLTKLPRLWTPSQKASYKQPLKMLPRVVLPLPLHIACRRSRTPTTLLSWPTA
jgi:ATP-binding cassette subfamily B (MDR/TAP) protein 1